MKKLSQLVLVVIVISLLFGDVSSAATSVSTKKVTAKPVIIKVIQKKKTPVKLAPKKLLKQPTVKKLIKKTNPVTSVPKKQTLLQPKVNVISSVSNIKDKISNVVQIVCPIKGGTSSGTGSIIYGFSNTDSKILTNKHVLKGATGPCGIYRTQDYEGTPTLYFQSGTTFIFSTDYDLAIITPDVKNLNSYQNTNFQFNQNSDAFDRAIWVLGYPPSAGNNITLTKGVVSGSENMNGIVMYKTDAKIDNGNSGGAVFDEDGKFMGVPTLAAQGNFSSYGYIIPSAVVKIFLNLVEQEGYGKQNWQHPQLSIYGVSPSNTVPEPTPRAPQNPAPQPKEDPSLKIAQCQALRRAQTGAMKQALYKQAEDSFGKNIADAEEGIRKAKLEQLEIRMNATPEYLRTLSPEQQASIRESSAAAIQPTIDYYVALKQKNVQLLQEARDMVDRQLEQLYNEESLKCFSS